VCRAAIEPYQLDGLVRTKSNVPTPRGPGRPYGRTMVTVTLSRGAILCDFAGCWTSLVVSSPIEVILPPVDDIIQHRAWVKGWTTDDQDQDFCSRHHSPGK
jgi:hypothetical protein